VSVKIEVDGIALTVTQTGLTVRVERVVGRDRKTGRDLTSGRSFDLDAVEPDAIAVVRALRQVAARLTARCTCGYSYGWSDHAQHCQSIYVAEYEPYVDD
jgi:hypothetical protein